MGKKPKKEWFNFNTAVILLVIIALLVILKTAFTPPETAELLKATKNDLVKEAEIVLNTLTDGRQEVSLLDSNGLAEEKIRNLDAKDYDEIKSMLGIENDFCIYFEDVTGNPVKIDSISPAIGSNKIYINGKPCR